MDDDKMKTKKTDDEKDTGASVAEVNSDDSDSDVEVEDRSRGKQVRNLVILLIVAITVVTASAFAFTKYKTYFIVGKVGNTYIFRYELTSRLVDLYGDSVLDDLITKRLVEEELKKAGINVNERQIDEKIEEIKQNLGDMDLEDALNMQNVSMDDFRDQVKLQIGVEEHVASRVDVKPEEVDDFIGSYGEQLKGSTDEEKRAEAVDILVDQRLQQEINAWIAEIREAAEIQKYL